MARQKKIKSLQVEETQEVLMSDSQVLESLETEIDKARLELEKAKSEVEEKKAQLKTMTAREVTEDEMIIVKKQVSMSSEKAALKAKIEKQRQHDSEMVTGKFMNRRAPGNAAKLTYMKYETDPVKWYNLEDGKVYTIPRGFADQLNEHYYTPHFIQKQGEMDPNKPSGAIHDVDTSNKKYAFVPVNF
jgi:hypothetical protein